MSTVVEEALDIESLVNEALSDLWAVVVLDDDVTTFEAVITALVVLFRHTPDAAEELAWRVHRTGEAVVHVDSEEEAARGVAALKRFGVRGLARPVSNS